MMTEKQIRRILLKNGYTLRKSRAKNWAIDNQRGYMIVRDDYNAVVAGE